MDYKPKNILITGIAGFIGSNVLAYLANKYPSYYFVGIDTISYCSNVKNFQEISQKDNFIFIKADIKDINFVDFIFDKYTIDTVMHFAAYTHVDHSFGNSLIFTENNVYGTHVLLEISKKYNIKRFIHVSTDEVYGSQAHTQSNENSIIDPTNPYAATKAAAEHIVRSYYHSFKFPIIITRGNNVYGPKQYPEKLIPRFILRLLKNLKCTVHGSGQQLRSFLYVDDVSKAFDIILHKGIIGEIYNIGCSDEHSVISVTKDLVKYLKPGDKLEDWLTFVKDRDFNDQRYFISVNKLESLGWRQEIFFEQGLNNTIEWYKNNPNHWDIQDINTILEK